MISFIFKFWDQYGYPCDASSKHFILLNVAYTALQCALHVTATSQKVNSSKRSWFVQQLLSLSFCGSEMEELFRE